MLHTIARFVSDSGARAGKGALAGLVATAAMTASSTIEMNLRKREPSTATVSAGGKVLGVQPRNPEGAARFGQFVHWTYGAAWGAFGGVLRRFVSDPMAVLVHLVAVWGTEVTVLPSLDVAPPLPEQDEPEIAIDLWHHAVYVAAFAAAYSFFDRRSRR